MTMMHESARPLTSISRVGLVLLMLMEVSFDAERRGGQTTPMISMRSRRNGLDGRVGSRADGELRAGRRAGKRKGGARLASLGNAAAQRGRAQLAAVTQGTP